MEILSKITSKYVDIDKIIQKQIRNTTILNDLPWLKDLTKFKYSDLKSHAKLDSKDRVHDDDFIMKLFKNIDQIDKEVLNILKFLFEFKQGKINVKSEHFLSKLKNIKGLENLTDLQKSLLIKSVNAITPSAGDILNKKLLFITKKNFAGTLLLRSVFRPISNIWDKFLNYSSKKQINKLKKAIDESITIRAKLRDEINDTRKKNLIKKLKKQEDNVVFCLW